MITVNTSADFPIEESADVFFDEMYFYHIIDAH